MSNSYNIHKKLKRLKQDINGFKLLKEKRPYDRRVDIWRKELMTRFAKLSVWYPWAFTLERWPESMEQMFL